MGDSIKDINETTSQDAYTTSNIPSNPQLKSNLNDITDVNPSSRESENTFNPDRQSAPYGSSTLNSPTQVGKPSSLILVLKVHFLVLILH